MRKTRVFLLVTITFMVTFGITAHPYLGKTSNNFIQKATTEDFNNTQDTFGDRILDLGCTGVSYLNQVYKVEEGVIQVPLKELNYEGSRSLYILFCCMKLDPMKQG